MSRAERRQARIDARALKKKLVAQFREDDVRRARHADPFTQLSAALRPTTPIVPISKPASAEEQALVIRRLWGGVDPQGNGWSSFPAQTVEDDEVTAARIRRENDRRAEEIEVRRKAGVRLHGDTNIPFAHAMG